MGCCACPDCKISIWVSRLGIVRCLFCGRFWQVVARSTVVGLAITLMPLSDDVHTHQERPIYKEYVSKADVTFVNTTGSVDRIQFRGRP